MSKAILSIIPDTAEITQLAEEIRRHQEILVTCLKTIDVVIDECGEEIIEKRRREVLALKGQTPKTETALRELPGLIKRFEEAQEEQDVYKKNIAKAYLFYSSVYGKAWLLRG